MHCYKVEILNLFDQELQLINTKPVIKNKLKQFLNELKKFKVQTILALDYKQERIIKSPIQVLNKLLEAFMKNLDPCIKALWKK